ncbi:transcriptional regulator [Niabella ginsenosidivorans]|uniref:Transcriptional regulator n=1 Tax=Niabella ginsenosidivorans TaxID=1176587 RepID=A0A1A9I7T7_9BACT|nr:response regulator [Niabella ginsenosidivorans]ANH83109.1 transcriptional regulator [Niabella ginsenosidivorans]
MIKKVLIAEDHESANISVQKTLEELKIAHTDYVYYCDDALIKIEKAKQAGDSYDLLITDLYFEKDHREQQLSGGTALIEAARKAQPELKVLVFSAENKPAIIDGLFHKLEIDGYVRKARGDAKELMTAINAIAGNQRYFPRQIIQHTKQKNAHEFSDFDITILSLMIEGKRQQEISDHLKRNNIQPSGLSSIEKRLNYIKETLNFSTNEQLIAHCIKMGIV